jgi:dipeptidyl aminopeptidase/acylaminoacyl peptidase
MPRRIPVLMALALSATTAPQQQPPPTEVYLMSMQPGAGVGWINISNNPGYDNQPSFLPDSSAVLFSSNRDGKQTDIYRYDIDAKKLTQLTKTTEAEYSPLVTPDNKTFSVIRVEADGAQRLWRFEMDGTNPRLVLENIKPVGYHAWIDATHLALFVLGTPATLQIADTTTGNAEVVDQGIGRSILIHPKTGNVTYMTTGATRMLKEWNPKTKRAAPTSTPLENSQDAAWTPDGTLLMASGTSVLTPRLGLEWKPLVDLSSDGSNPQKPAIKSITRLAVSPNGRWLAFVAEPSAASEVERATTRERTRSEPGGVQGAPPIKPGGVQGAPPIRQ